MKHSDKKRRDNLISQELLTALRADIDLRRIEHGKQQLAGGSQIFQSFHPTMKNAASFLAMVAQWCDLGFGDFEIVKKLLDSYSGSSRLDLSVADYIQVRLAEGIIALSKEMTDDAIGHFDTVLTLANEAKAWDVISVASYWMARSHKEKGFHDTALAHIARAREVQRTNDRPFNEGPSRAFEGSVLFDKGKVEDATENLQIAQKLLDGTDDYETLGNIQSVYGRIMHRDLRYDQAIKHYQDAIDLFQKSGTKPINIGQAIVDMSFSRFNTARRLRRNVESYSEKDRKNGQEGPSRSVLVSGLSALYDQTLGDLNRASQIYDQNPHARGIGRVHVIRGFIYLDMGELDLATNDAEKAYRFAEPWNDFYTMASARNLECMVENTAFEEEVGGVAEHAVAALDYAREAVDLASNTQNRTLLASCNISLGLTLSNTYFNMRDAAREAMERASSYLEPDVRNLIRENFQRLKKRLREEVALESKLLGWAHGEASAKTFRELEEDFAGLIIPRVWEEEKRQITHVVARLSISPKRVRRVLRTLGLLETTDAPAPKKLRRFADPRLIAKKSQGNKTA